MKSLLLLHNTEIGVAAGTTRFHYVQGGGGGDLTENNTKQVVAANGTIGNVYAAVSIPPGAGKNYTFILRINGADSGLSFTISDSATSGSYTGNVSVSAGDVVDWAVTVDAGASNPTKIRISAVFEGTNSAQAVFLGHGTGMVAGSEKSINLTGYQSSIPIASNYAQLCSEAGTLKNLYVALSTAPGAGQNIVFKVYKNGVATSLTCTISNTDTTGNDTSNTVSVAAGDRLTLSTLPSAGAAVGRVWHGTVFEPTTEGNFPLLNSHYTYNSNVLNSYDLPGFSSTTGFTSTNEYKYIFKAGTLKNLYVRLTGAPGAGKEWVYTIRKGAANTSLTTTVADTNTTNSDTSNSVVIADNDEISILQDPNNSPTGSNPLETGLTWVASADKSQLSGSVVII